MRRLILRCVVALTAVLPSLATAQDPCNPPKVAAKLPAVSALLDSATLIANLPAPDVTGAKELFVRVTPGSPARVVVLDSVAAKTDAGKILVQKIVASLRPNAKNVMGAFRLRVLLGETPALAVLPLLECPKRK